MRVAVTGGSGRVGSVLIRHLLERGYSVINLDRRQASEPLARFVYVDLRLREQVQAALEQVDAVCHLGEIPNANVSLSPDEVYWHNTRCGSVVMQSAADLKLQRVLYTSSCQVYGFWAGRGPEKAKPLHLPMDETHLVNPQNVYALSKACNEQYAKLMATTHGLSIASIRLPWVMNHVPLDDLSWIDKHRGDSDGLGTYLHGDDAARAFVAALENPRPGYEVYHFSATDVISGIPLRQRLAQSSPDFPPLPEDWAPFRSPVLTHKAREHLGWEPQFAIIDHYREKYGRDPGS
jgi:nucleoside-diphosphate-sugar epimerase